jgi:hypothetical protein
MEQQTFDANVLLSKIRQQRPPQQSPSVFTDSRPTSQFGRGGQHSPAHPQRNRFYRKERPEVRIELENEVEHLTGEVARLKRENKQLQIEKEDMEYRCSEMKEKADLTISKLRNKLVALNKKFNEANKGAPTTYDQYVAKKKIEKDFSRGAGVLNITNMTPPTVPSVNSESVQSMTFSQFMKRTVPAIGSEEFNSSSRQHHAQNDSNHHIRHPINVPISGFSANVGYPPSHSSPKSGMPTDEDYENYNYHQSHQSSPPLTVGGSSSTAHWKKKTSEADHHQAQQLQQHEIDRRSMRSKSIAQPRPPDDAHDIQEGFSDTIYNEIEDETSVLDRAEELDEDLPIVDIDLRNS